MKLLSALLFTILLASHTSASAQQASPLVAAVLPNARSVQVGTAATVFATVINTNYTALTGCEVVLPASAPSGFSLNFQTTDLTTNAPTGTVNQPVPIPPISTQSFVLSFQSTSPLTAAQLAPQFICQNASAAPLTTGVNTVDLDFSATPVVDVIALAVTPTGDGILRISNGIGAFAVATIDAGAAGDVVVSMDTGDTSLPVTIVFCTNDPNPALGTCLDSLLPASGRSIAYTAGSTMTLSIFVTALGPVPNDPDTARIFVRFTDSNGVSHGSTSVAVTTALDFF